MASLRQQIKQRRKALGLRQEDMGQRIGMLRQQYQYLEAKGNPAWTPWSWSPKGWTAR